MDYGNAIYNQTVNALLCDVIYDKPLNGSLSNRKKSVQYKAVLAITVAIQDHLEKNYTRN